jgi:hypothetical protein
MAPPDERRAALLGRQAAAALQLEVRAGDSNRLKN